MTHVHHIVIDRLKKNFCFNDTEYFEENLCRTITAYHQDTCIGQFNDLHRYCNKTVIWLLIKFVILLKAVIMDEEIISRFFSERSPL